MSKKSVMIALPQQAQQAPAIASMEADRWVEIEAHHGLGPGRGVIDLTADRNPMELACLIWFFPAMATWHWMANLQGRYSGAWLPKAGTTFGMNPLLK